MDDSIVVALIGLVGSGLGSLIGVIASSKLTQYRLQQLEKQVEKHNKVIERVYKLEKNEAVIEEELEQDRCRIEKLEKYHSP